jgi:hypothetical protein
MQKGSGDLNGVGPAARKLQASLMLMFAPFTSQVTPRMATRLPVRYINMGPSAGQSPRTLRFLSRGRY